MQQPALKQFLNGVFMSINNSPLDNLKIASPCSASWNEMYGTDRKRFCGDCKLNVYNLSRMTRDAAERLLISSEGRLCVRFYRRPDGTVLTKDCPVGWAKVRQRLSLYATAAFSLLLSFMTGMSFAALFERAGAEVGKIAVVLDSPPPEPVIMGTMTVTQIENGWEKGAVSYPSKNAKNRHPKYEVGMAEIPARKAN
jgi:hypothetical protein